MSVEQFLIFVDIIDKYWQYANFNEIEYGKFIQYTKTLLNRNSLTEEQKNVYRDLCADFSRGVHYNKYYDEDNDEWLDKDYDNEWDYSNDHELNICYLIRKSVE
jgi:hypothetical protein